MGVKVLYATSNKGKFVEVEKRFKRYGVELVLPKDLNIELEVPETGRTLEANAARKVRLYAARLRSQELSSSGVQDINQMNNKSNDQCNNELNQEKQRQKENSTIRRDDYIIMADDTGLSIDALGREPGAKVRRWRDGVTMMSDKEIVDYCIEQMQRVPPEGRSAEFRTVVTLLLPAANLPAQAGQNLESEEVEYFDGRLRGVILEQPVEERTEGLPLCSVFYVPDWGMTLAQRDKLPDKEKEKYVTHREIAVDRALERILEWGSTQD